jgi:chromosome segregation and condensation protein ScpB
MSKFAGSDYQPERDDFRLTGQRQRVYAALHAGKPLTLAAIASITGDPEASISAQIRHLRKAKHGGHKIDRIHIKRGLFMYRLDQNGTSSDSA